MKDQMEVNNNYNDISTDSGFQFEFNCGRCNVGFRSKFSSFIAGNIAGALNTANNLFGGIFGKASEIGENVRSASWQKAHDDAFTSAQQEVKEVFSQCPRCQSWVCLKKCWNHQKGLCKNCAPDLGVEMSAAQASKSVEEVWANAAMAQEDKKLSTENWRETIVASCPKCHAPQKTNAKFCSECGEPLKPKNTCSQCQAKLSSGAKFCPECGAKA